MSRRCPLILVNNLVRSWVMAKEAEVWTALTTKQILVFFLSFVVRLLRACCWFLLLCVAGARRSGRPLRILISATGCDDDDDDDGLRWRRQQQQQKRGSRRNNYSNNSVYAPPIVFSQYSRRLAPHYNCIRFLSGITENGEDELINTRQKTHST